MKVRLSSEARKDLIAIGDYIARDNPLRASTFVAELVWACVELSSTPLGYPIVQRYEAKGIRRRVYGNYHIFYRVTGEQVFVIRVLHGARDTGALL
jgi:plasmid stabilization system protein ParE